MTASYLQGPEQAVATFSQLVDGIDLQSRVVDDDTAHDDDADQRHRVDAATKEPQR